VGGRPLVAELGRPRRSTAAVRRGRWPVTGALLLALLAVSWVLSGLIAGSAWWWALVGTGALLLVAPAILRTLGVPRLVASLLDLVLAALVVGVAFEIAPNREGLERVAELAEVAVRTIEGESVPATSFAELRFVIVAAGALVAVLLDLLAATLPSLVGVVLLAVIAIAALFQPHGVDLLAVAGCAVAYLLVLLADGRIRRAARAPAAVAVIAASTVLALAVTPLIPGLERRSLQGEWTDPVLHRASSLIDLGEDLRAASPSEVLRYRSGRAPTPYLQLATLEEYNGTTWVHRDRPEVAMTGGASAASVDLPAGVEAEPFEVEVEIRGLEADWAPAPYPALAVTGAEGDWYADTGDGSLRIDGAGLGGQDYRVLTVAISPEPEHFGAEAAGGGLPDAVLPSLELPADLPGIIVETANAVAADASTPIERAQALQSYLRFDGGFEYSLETPDAESDDGMAVVASFLERKSGYCIHFAAAMTVMARALGIPARIAIGYLPGRTVVDGWSGATWSSVSNLELHAWPQLYFEGFGWLAFEPTVGRGTAPSYSRATGGAVEPTTAPTASAAPSAAPDRDEAAQDEPEETAGVAGTTAAERLASALAWIGIALLLLALLLTPAALRAARRRRRLRSLAAGGPVTIAWAEVADTARDLRTAPEPSETPRAFAGRIAASWPPERRAELDALLADVERAAFGPEPVAGDARGAARTAAVIAAILEARPGRERLLARLVPRSLLVPFDALRALRRPELAARGEPR